MLLYSKYLMNIFVDAIYLYLLELRVFDLNLAFFDDLVKIILFFSLVCILHLNQADFLYVCVRNDKV